MKRRFVIVAAAVLSMVAAVALGGGKASAQVPMPAASTGGPYTGVVGVPVQVSGLASTGFNLAFAWVWGDGTASNGPVASHVYAAPGVYTITLTVSDGVGRQSVATTTATITGPALGTVVPSNFGLYPYGYFGVNNCFQTLSGIFCNGGLVNPFFNCNTFNGFCNNLIVNNPVVGTTQGYNLTVPGVGTFVCTTVNYNPATCVRVVGR